MEKMTPEKKEIDKKEKYVHSADIEKNFAGFTKYTIILPENWFEDIKENEINDIKKRIRDTFDYRKRKLNSDNPNYSHILKLFALGYRYPRVKQWLDNLINEFKSNLHRKFEDNIGRMAFIFHKMSLAGELPFDHYIKTYNIIPSLLFDGKSYEELLDDEKEECLSFFILLTEIFSLNTLIKQRTDNIKKKIRLNYVSLHVAINDLYNYLDKLDEVFKRLVNSSILNKPVKIYERVRNSIIHAHFVPDWSQTTQDEKGNRILQLTLIEWEESNWKSNTSYRLRYKHVGRIKESSSVIFEEMIITVSIISQIMSLYVFFSQSKNKSLLDSK